MQQKKFCGAFDIAAGKDAGGNLNLLKILHVLS
jgi:hypothetical protein